MLTHEWRQPETALLVNQTTGRTLARRARIARSLWAQLVGLIGSRGTLAAPGEALGLPDCGAVHTAGVRVRLDVVFCDASGRVLDIVADLRPWRLGACRGTVRRAAIAWEAPAGTLAPYVHPGDVLALAPGEGGLTDAARQRSDPG
jgi:uncharacterized membrane protein (UPF0127 family)